MKQTLLKNSLCKLGYHNYKPFKRSGEVNWLWMTIEGKRCVNCRKEILKR